MNEHNAGSYGAGIAIFFNVESDNFRRILTGGLVGITVAVTVKFIARKIKFSR